jgi:hypothetical protein
MWMSINDMTFKFGGEAGQGVESTGHGLAQAIVRAGLHVFALQDYHSRIRGGHNFYQIRVANDDIPSHDERVHLLVALTEVAVALAESGTFISRGWSGDIEHLTWLMGEALKHRGYALLDVLQPCVSFNRMYSYEWLRSRVYKLQNQADYDSSDRSAALAKAEEWGDRIPIGILYRTESMPAYEEQVPALAAGPLVKQLLRDKTDSEYEMLKQEYV